jgi:hypothetical protein
VTLETGPDTEIGLFGALTEHATDSEYVPVMRFEPTAVPGSVKILPTRLIAPAAADPSGAIAADDSSAIAAWQRIPTTAPRAAGR